MTFVRGLFRALLVCALVQLAAPQPAAALPEAVKHARVRQRRPAFARELRRKLIRAGAEVVPRGKVFYHQIKQPEHRAQWKAAHEKQGLKMLGKWLTAGRGGIWTFEEARGWYGDHGGKPVTIELKPGALFIDLDVPAHRAIYDAWKKAREREPAAGQDLFTLLKDESGVEMRRKIAGIRAPKDGQFLQDLGIAGVVWYDTYGRRCPIVLNPSAVKDVKF